MSNSASCAKHIDLRGTPCPINLIKCKLALEELQPIETLKVDLDRGEPESMVISSLEDAGFLVEVVHKEQDWISVIIQNKIG